MPGSEVVRSRQTGNYIQRLRKWQVAEGKRPLYGIKCAMCRISSGNFTGLDHFIKLRRTNFLLYVATCRFVFRITGYKTEISIEQWDWAMIANIGLLRNFLSGNRGKGRHKTSPANSPSGVLILRARIIIHLPEIPPINGFGNCQPRTRGISKMGEIVTVSKANSFGRMPLWNRIWHCLTHRLLWRRSVQVNEHVPVW